MNFSKTYSIVLKHRKPKGKHAITLRKFKMKLKRVPIVGTKFIYNDRSGNLKYAVVKDIEYGIKSNLNSQVHAHVHDKLIVIYI